MNTSLITTACLLIAGLFLPVLPVRAGTVLSTNLPAGTHIVNIDARADGTASFGAGQFLFYQPAPTAPSVTLPAGTYRFRVVNPADAAALYPGLTAAQLSQIYTGWTFNAPWSENYFVFNASAAGNPAEHQLFDGALDPAVTLFGSAEAAYSGTITNGYYHKIRPAPPGRSGGAATYVSEWTFATATTLLFVIPDNGLGDNTGGVSVIVSPVSPAPLPAYAQAVLDAGPVAYWRFDEGGGVTAADSAGTFPGTLTAAGAVFTGCGVSGNAVSLNRASGGMVNMGNAVPGFTSGDYSIMLWVKNTETVIDTLPLSKHTTNSQNGYIIQINRNFDGGAPNKAMFTAGAELPSLAPLSTTNVNDGRWHQIVGVYRAGGTHSIHVDGSPAQGTKTSRGMPGNSAPFLIGGVAQGATPTAYYTGLVDEVALFNRALSDAEIATLYHEAGTPMVWDLHDDWSNAANPNGVWRYNEGTNALPAVPAWQQTLGGWSTAQPGWAESQDGNNRLPFWFRSNGSETFARDYLAGDVVLHATDEANGVGNAEGNVTWTSPITGIISICGSVWMGREIGRSTTWTLSRNGTALTAGAISSGDVFSRAHPHAYSYGTGGPSAVAGISVVPGDVIKLEFARNTAAGGDFVGVNLSIVAPASPAQITAYVRNPTTGTSNITFATEEGGSYSLWGSSSLANWTELFPSLAGTGSPFTTMHTPPGSPVHYFYHVRRNRP